MRPDGSPALFFGLLFGSLLWVVCGMLVYFGWSYWKHKVSEHWPRVAAAFEGGTVEIRQGRHGKQYYFIAMTFTYQIAGQTFHGEYKKSLVGYSEKEADQLLRSLREGPLYVRYRSSKREDYVCDPFRDVRP
jgi:hypothetical protein